jgi:large subunit ribosomal protein L29
LKASDNLKALRNKTVVELREQIHQHYKDLYELRSKTATGQVPNPKLFGAIKRDIARCLTLVTEKERAEAANR